MANLAGRKDGEVRVLDPGAGTGILAAALCERFRGATHVHVDAYEVDPDLAELCRETLHQVRELLSEHATSLSFQVQNLDFISETACSLSPTLFDQGTGTKPYDFAILNPPYFKLGKKDYRSLAASLHAQPNIYSAFMAITAGLLADKGVMVAIVPRSFATGAYFRRFRQTLFSMVAPEAVHVFDSRKEAFRDDGVLQENVILKLRRRLVSPTDLVQVSKSAGLADLGRRSPRSVPIGSILTLGSRNLWLTIPESDDDDEIMSVVRSWPCRLRDLGLEISTGPVVAFRAREFLFGEEKDRERTAVPLVWMNNIRAMQIDWPLPSVRKPQYIEASERSAHILIPNSTYVLLRRFTAKEERRRLTAVPILKGDLPGNLVGLENHLNYIHRPGGEMKRTEAMGLAALLNSSLVDRYFRLLSGSTQVNAVEMRDLPLPAAHIIESIGQLVRMQGISATDEAVYETAGLKPRLFGKTASGQA